MKIPLRLSKVQVYRDVAGQYRWRRRSRNGRNVATSGEGYATNAGALLAAQRENPGLPVVVLPDRD